MELLVKAVPKYKTKRHIANNLKERFMKFFKNKEIICPDGETGRNEQKTDDSQSDGKC